MQNKFRLVGVLMLVAVMFSLLARFDVLQRQTYQTNTWSIVAVDVATGDVGVAAASCVPVESISALAVLVPGHGAAAVQAQFFQQHRDYVFELMQQGATAQEIIAAVTDLNYDPRLPDRQYGIVTQDELGVQAEGFTGNKNFDIANDVQDGFYAVSVQGNYLEGGQVISDALTAFRAEDAGPLPLPDRLMRALEAGSAAGGDVRCNGNTLPQTASAAFVAVAKADQPPFVEPQFGGFSPNHPDAPWLYLSVKEPRTGLNPLIELRRQYNDWRGQNLPPCADCDLSAIVVPPGNQTPLEVDNPANWLLLLGTALSLVILIPALIVVGVIFFFRRRRDSNE